MPGADPGQFQASYKAPPGISLERSMEIAAELESAEHRSRSAAASCCSDQAEYTG
jgi:multidrug efflux pump subunit AcrB